MPESACLLPLPNPQQNFPVCVGMGVFCCTDCLVRVFRWRWLSCYVVFCVIHTAVGSSLKPYLNVMLSSTCIRVTLRTNIHLQPSAVCPLLQRKEWLLLFLLLLVDLQPWLPCPLWFCLLMPECLFPTIWSSSDPCSPGRFDGVSPRYFFFLGRFCWHTSPVGECAICIFLAPNAASVLLAGFWVRNNGGSSTGSGHKPFLFWSLLIGITAKPICHLGMFFSTVAEVVWITGTRENSSFLTSNKKRHFEEN